MKLTIDDKVCSKHKMTLQEVFLSLAVRQGNIKDALENMIAREIVVKQNDEYLLTQHWSEVLDEILTDSLQTVEKSDEELLKLAVEVQKCFPQDKMLDKFGRETPYYYRCNRSEIAKSLKRFFTQYGNNYSDEDIIDAAKRYVASFNGNYSGMRLAKYFIMKNPIKKGEDGNGYVEQVSDLLTFLENKDSGEGRPSNDDSWLLNSRN